MTEFVQRFIEANIDAIDEKDWDEVIEQWYSNASSNFVYNDDEFNELSIVMSSAGIDFMQESLKARTEFMKNLFSQILHEELEGMTWRGSNEIKKSNILMILDSDLGFIKEELEPILDDVAENEYNLEVDFTCFYVR
jgi:hypothetical protein